MYCRTCTLASSLLPRVKWCIKIQLNSSYCPLLEGGVTQLLFIAVFIDSLIAVLDGFIFYLFFQPTFFYWVIVLLYCICFSSLHISIWTCSYYFNPTVQSWMMFDMFPHVFSYVCVWWLYTANKIYLWVGLQKKVTWTITRPSPSICRSSHDE